jgi:CheY-like chemotaxis protein/HPt (histidine-containing phosphotransfer) domain-containing protein
MSAQPIRLLLVEDDPISLDFMCEALAGVPAIVDAAGDIASATWLARERPYALWLLDAHLPDGGGLDCLRTLRVLAPTPALAVTASNERAELDALCAGGFLEVLVKPVSVLQAQSTVRRLLGLGAGGVREPAADFKLPVWDEDRALAALGGKSESLARLRRMFLDELPGLREQVREACAARDAAATRAVLHKLKAGCGFVGALRLGQAVESLSRLPLDSRAQADFEHAAQDALQAGAGQS